MINQLYIIGNGFDIAHGYPTQLSNFIKWLRKTNHFAFFEVADYFDDDALWNDFEFSLDTFDFTEFTNGFYPIEDTPQGEAKFIGNIQYTIFDFVKLSNLLTEWLHTINFSACAQLCTKLNPDAYFLTFNYTPTLELHYNVPKENILHIHGNILNNEELICGHNDVEYVDKLKHRNEINQGEFIEQNLDELEYHYFYSTLKKEDEIINKYLSFFNKLLSINEINVLGHSLNQIDFSYFYKIYSIVSNKCVWKFHCFSNKDISVAKEFINKLGIVNFQVFTLNDTEYYMN